MVDFMKYCYYKLDKDHFSGGVKSGAHFESETSRLEMVRKKRD